MIDETLDKEFLKGFNTAYWLAKGSEEERKQLRELMDKAPDGELKKGMEAGKRQVLREDQDENKNDMINKIEELRKRQRESGHQR